VGSSTSSGSATFTDIRASLWDHVHITESSRSGMQFEMEMQVL
jgi:hypothetical protein